MQNRQGDENALSQPDTQLARIAIQNPRDAPQTGQIERLDSFAPPLVATRWLVGSPGFLELRADFKRRVQRRQGALRNQPDPAAAYLAHPPLRQREKIVAFKRDRALPRAAAHPQ